MRISFLLSVYLLSVLRFLKVNEFDECHLRAVTAAGTEFVNLGVTAIYSRILRSDNAEQLGYSVLVM